MPPNQIQRLRADFEEWTGGFGPESGNEICIYIESSLPDDLDPEEAVEELLRWMDEDADRSLDDALEDAMARSYVR